MFGKLTKLEQSVEMQPTKGRFEADLCSYELWLYEGVPCHYPVAGLQQDAAPHQATLEFRQTGEVTRRHMMDVPGIVSYAPI